MGDFLDVLDVKDTFDDYILHKEEMFVRGKELSERFMRLFHFELHSYIFESVIQLVTFRNLPY